MDLLDKNFKVVYKYIKKIKEPIRKELKKRMMMLFHSKENITKDTDFFKRTNGTSEVETYNN